MARQLRYYQQEAKEAVERELKKGVIKQLVVLPTGSGKTKVTVDIIKDKGRSLWGTHTEELIEQSAIALLSEQELMPDDQLIKTINDHHGLISLLKNNQIVDAFTDPLVKLIVQTIGVIKADLFIINKPIVIASMQTLWRRLDKIRPDYFDSFVIDECFPKGTLIDGNPIENIKVGDTVSSFNHTTNCIEKRKVLSLFKNEVKTDLIEVKLIDGTSFICTSNHPVYSKEFGYIAVTKLMEYDKNMLHLLKRLQLHSSQSKIQTLLQPSVYKQGETGVKAICRNLLSSLQLSCNYFWEKIAVRLLPKSVFLFRKLQKRSLYGYSCESIKDENNVKYKRSREDKQKDEGKEPYVQSRNESQNGSIDARKNISFSWRQWRAYETSINDALGNRIRNGILNSYYGCKALISKCSDYIQSGLRRSRSETCYRNRWQDSQTKEVEIFGSSEDRNFEFVRVDSYKVYQRGSREFCEKMSQENYVYNIEVEGNNNYFVENTLVHNCHYAGAKTWLTSVNYFKPKLLIGISATPTRADGMLLGDIFDKIVYEYKIEQAIADGFLCEIDAIRIKTQSSLDNVRTLGGELNQGQLEEVINTPARNELIVDKYLQYCSGKQFIAFCVDVQHAIDLTEAFKNKGVNVDFVVGDKELTEDRKGTIAKYKEGKLTGIINVMILTAGFDHPNTGAILMCCPTKSLTKFLQQIGRGTRLKDEAYVTSFGQKVTILDFIDVTSKHRLINTWTLDEGKEIEDRVFVSTEKKLLLINARIERTFKATEQQKDIKIDLLKLPKVKISDSIRMQEPATEAQLDRIAKAGYDVVNSNYTKAMCSSIISGFPAYPSQVQQLVSAGYDVSKGVTLAEYNQAIKDIYARDAKANTQRLKDEKKFPFKDL